MHERDHWRKAATLLHLTISLFLLDRLWLDPLRSSQRKQNSRKKALTRTHTQKNCVNEQINLQTHKTLVVDAIDVIVYVVNAHDSLLILGANLRILLALLPLFLSVPPFASSAPPFVCNFFLQFFSFFADFCLKRMCAYYLAVCVCVRFGLVWVVPVSVSILYEWCKFSII